MRNLGRSFKRLAARHGEVFSVFVGAKPVVVLSSFDSIRDAFERREFSGRPNMYHGTFFQKGKSGVSTTEGELWEAQRTFLHERMVNVNGK